MNQIFYMNKNAISVIRISSGRQSDGLSPDIQKDSIRGYCKRLGLIIEKEFNIIESAKSSKDRTKYKEAIRYAEKNRIGNIVFYMFDRESRNFTDLEENEDKVLKGIFNIHYVKENSILHRDSPDSDFLTRSFSGIMARQFIRNLKTKVSEGMNKKAENGWYPSNNPPLGYALQKPIDPETGKVKSRGSTIIPDPNMNNQKIVLREFELRAQGLSFDRIREQIVSENLIPPKKLKSYTATAIHKRLKHPFYRGDFIWQLRQYKGKHEVFVPRDLLTKVDQSLGLRGCTIKRENSDYTTLTGGWLKCICGCHVVYDPKKKLIRSTNETKTYHLYHCTNGKKVHASMRGMNVTNDQIWIQLGSALDDISIPPELAKDISQALNQIETKAHATTKKQIELFKQEEVALQIKEDKLLNMRLDGEIDQELFESKLKRIRADRKSITDQIEVLQLSLTSAVIETVQSVLELARNAKLLWISQSPAEKKKVLDMILSNPILDGSNIRYDLKKPFRILKEMKGNKEWRTLRDSNSRPIGSKPTTLSS